MELCGDRTEGDRLTVSSRAPQRGPGCLGGDSLTSQAACKLCRVVLLVEVGLGDTDASESFLFLEHYQSLLL